MKERPILFSGPMVRAILDGRKTQTRRAVKPQPLQDQPELRNGIVHWPTRVATVEETCPYGQAGDVLWVREKWAKSINNTLYAADHGSVERIGDGPRDVTDEWDWDRNVPNRWKPSIHMPRASCRLRIEVVSVRVERVQEISEVDAIAEGVQSERDHYGDPAINEKYLGTIAWHRYDEKACSAMSAVESYSTLWDSINGKGSWASNPWVWVVEFKRTEKP